MNDPSIKFNIKTDKNKTAHSVEIYRLHKKENGEERWSYIDSFHPMSKMELHTLKNFLQEYLHNNDWY